MESHTPQKHFCFKSVPLYTKKLEQLTTVAWKTPNKLTHEEVEEVRNLCSLTKCEASVWYLLRRARKEKQREDEDSIIGMDVQQTLALVRKYKMTYLSKKLIDFNKDNLKNSDNVTQNFHDLRYRNKVDDEHEAMAMKILTMTSELTQLFDNDAAFIFYLETGLTANAFKLLYERPLPHRDLIEGYAELDRLKGCRTERVNDLVKRLNKELKKELNKEQKREKDDTEENGQPWWIGTDEQWQQFIGQCTDKGWLCTNGENQPYTDPYMLADSCCHIAFLRHVVELSLKGTYGIVPLRPGNERNENDGRISCLKLAEGLSRTFCTRFTAGQVSNARKAVMSKNKKRLIVSHPSDVKKTPKSASRKKRKVHKTI